jgi:hypothetical protein
MRAARLAGLGVVIGAVTLAVGSAGASRARDALIRPGVGIGKIRMEMRVAAVRRALRKPTAAAKRRRLGFGSEYVEYTWGAGPNWRVGVVGRPGDQVVVMVATTLAGQRTRTGVGVGSTYRTVQRRLGAHCRRDTKPGDLAFKGVCFIGVRGLTQTVFSFFGTCNLPPRTVIVCPTTRRILRVYEVLIATADGLELSGSRP